MFLLRCVHKGVVSLGSLGCQDLLHGVLGNGHRLAVGLRHDLLALALRGGLGIGQDLVRLHPRGVTLLLGEVSGVVPDLLLDAWRWAADKKPIAQGAELIVEPVEAVTHCEACGCDYATVEHGKACPHCGSGETYLLQGQEVMIKQIETPDEDPADAAPDGLSDVPDAVDAANPLHIA